MDQSLINRIVEGALLASSQPLTLAQLKDLFPEEEPAPPGSIERALERLREACEGRGVELVEVASGFRYQVTGEVHGWISRLWTERKTRYTRATLETLALIAYRQPITRGEIEQVRGVAVSSNIIQALEEREWIRVVGHRDVPGKPALFGTLAVMLPLAGLFNWWALVVLPVAIAWAILVARQRVRHLGWAATDDVVAFRSGWLWRSVTVARVVKIQAVTRLESPFDRRSAMARVRVDTAGASERSHRVDIPYLARDTADGLCSRLAVQAASTEFRW